MVRDGTVKVFMGTGLPRIDHTFRAGQTLEKSGYPPGSLEEWHSAGLPLLPAD